MRAKVASVLSRQFRDMAVCRLNRSSPTFQFPMHTKREKHCVTVEVKQQNPEFAEEKRGCKGLLYGQHRTIASDYLLL
ncbi:hypothetical protein HOLleu_31597 [Holothuria leucospilota]|uniref:Uncharacterized protein n=1 Tax=Holothuria leucospilota TaxID=206669 RepID=A0A9Q1BHV4_HOLLE|nr:hypothetical protein HOLleu_31597 [Holothuria leucospilota]